MKRAYKIMLFATLTTIILSALAQEFYFQYNDGSRERDLIQDLKGLGYRFVLPRDYFAGDNQGKIALLIHDADFSLRGLDTFKRIELSLGVKSAIYPRFVLFDRPQDLLRAESEGFEIGFQQECLSMAKGNFTLANQYFRDQIAQVRTDFNIKTTDYHGDINEPNIINLNLYNQTIWKSYNLNEIYALTNYSYFSDTNNKLVSPQDPLKNLVIVQLHTDWTR